MIDMVRGLPRDLATALCFLTRLPLPALSRRQSAQMRGPAQAMAAFPLAGLVLGALLVGLDKLLGLTAFPLTTRNILLVVALVALTGGLHLEGLMDTCDGLIGGHDAQQRLNIMRDSRVGSYGVLGGVCVVLLKVGALGAVPNSARVLALLLTPMLGRWSLVLAAALFPPARPSGLGAAFRAGVTPPRLAAAAVTCVLAAWALGGVVGPLALVAACLATWLLGRAITAMIPGLTGDTYGAIAEMTEVVTLFLLALLGGNRMLLAITP
jgi:adenosylcobinamide-GDP ribazoletransferase